VRIETVIGEGTSVKVYLPRAAVLGTTAQVRVGDNDLLEACEPTLVLVVDDDSAVREVTASMLRDLGYTVLEAGSGGAALDALEQEPTIDVMLLDYAMPGMNGLEVERQSIKLRPGLPVVFVTGYADVGALVAAGEDRIVQKPFRGDELGRKLKAALGRTDCSARGKVIPLRRAMSSRRA
jgi:CheY-like chemotaxis protein